MITYKNKKGFTLIELLLVITAIGIFFAIALVALNPNKQLEAGRAVKRKADMDVIAKAIEQYVVNNRGKYPPALQSVVTGGTVGLCVTSPCVGGIDLTTDLSPYIAAIPLPQTGQYTITKTATGIIPGYDSSTIWATAGTTAPKLDLNFARDKQLVNAVDGTNPITFTRASTATYTGSDGLVKTAAANEPRFTYDPISKSSLGLLMEDSRTNLFLRSEEFDHLSWSKNTNTVTPNAVMSPSGTMSADLILPTAAFGYHPINQNFTLSTGNYYSFSVFVKAAGINSVFLLLGAGGMPSQQNATFNLVTGQISNISAGGVASAVQYPDNWWRISFVPVAATASALSTVNIYIGNSQFSGDGVSGVYLWGAMFESGNFTSSYIPTIGTAVTRAADNAMITGANFTATPTGWYNPSEFTIYSEAYGSSATTTQTNSGTGYPYIYSLHQSHLNRIAGARSAGSNNGSWALYSQPSGNFTYSSNANFNTSSRHKVGGVFGSSVYTPFANGVMGASITPGATLSAFTTLAIGSGTDGGYWGGTIARLIYWQTRLSDTILTNITK